MPDQTGWERRPGLELTGKRALVVGAETATGAAVARGLVEAGAVVALVAATTSHESLGALAGSLGGSSDPYIDSWDVANGRAVDDGMQRLAAAFGPVSILVTACDAPHAAPIGATDHETYRRTMGVIADGTYHACRAFVRALPEGTRNARIICITSVFGERGVDNLSAAAMAHGAVHNLVRALAQELGARDGATVNGIATGWMTDTPGRGPDDIGQNRLMRFVPMRRFGEPDEVAPLAVLLASEAAGYISGQILHVDGGITTHL